MMKMYSYILFLTFSSLTSITFAQATITSGMDFFKGDWILLLKEASQKKKLIFVDVYTDWCAPCKRMEQEVFPLKEVGQVYNHSFLNYRLNAERGEGIKLAKYYAIKSYPTYLFLDNAGNLIYRNGDYLKATEFIAAANEALKQYQVQDLSKLETRFKNGDRQPEFLRLLIEKRSSMQLDNTEFLNAYVAKVSVDKLSMPESLLFLSRNIGSTPSDALPVILKHINKLPHNDQRKVADQLYNKLLYYALGAAIKENKLKDAAKLLRQLDLIRPILAEKNLPSADNLALHYFKAARDTAGLKKIGYSIANQQFTIPIDSIKAKDRLLYEKAMKPFWNGSEDSTKIVNFQDEKRLASIQYSAHIATTLYTVSDFFKQTLPAQDKSLLDALKWMQFACLIYKNENLTRLRTELETMTR